MNNANHSLEKKYLNLLTTVFDCEESVLYDILVNCNLDYDKCYMVCEEYGFPKRGKDSKKRKKKEENIELNNNSASPLSVEENPYNDDDIQQLVSIFPDKRVEVLASIYWDSNNNLEKAIDKLLGKEKIYIPDEPSIELAYLHIKYPYIAENDLTALFLRNKNNYPRTEAAIERDYEGILQAHAQENAAFEREYGASYHRAVVNYFQKKIPIVNMPQVEEDVEERAPLPYMSEATRNSIHARSDAQLSRQRLQVLHNKRSEAARGYEKYCDYYDNQMQQEHAHYEECNQRSGAIIFSLKNDNQSIESMIQRGKSIDFHGLQVSEVSVYMAQIFSILQRSGMGKRVTVITGVGNHSRKNIPSVKLFVESFLRGRGVSFSEQNGQITF